MEASGHNWSPAEWGLRWLYNQPEVTVVLSGMNSEEMVLENCRTASETPEGSGEGFEVLSAELKKFVTNMTLKGYIVWAMCYHLVVLFYYISYRISCRVYKKGVLRDDI